MNKKQQTDAEKKKQKNSQIDVKNIGLDIDKMEYQQIVLSDSNFPGEGYFRGKD